MYITQNELVLIARAIGIDMSRTVLAIHRKKNPEIYEGVFKVIRGRAVLTYEREKAIEILVARELDENSAKYDVRKRVRRDKNEITEVATTAVDWYIANKRPFPPMHLNCRSTTIPVVEDNEIHSNKYN